MQWLAREWKHVKKNRELLLLSLPGFIYKFIFYYLPLVGLVIAFQNYNYTKGLFGSKWVGLHNFKFFFTSDLAWRVTRNTIFYNVAFIVLTTVFALVMALLLNELSKRWFKVHQTVMFLPYFLSWVVVGYIATGFFDYQHGALNTVLASFGVDPTNWYQKASYWPTIMIVVQLWKAVGFQALIYYAGIIAIDPSYYEAARIDGATKWQMIRKITLPLLTPLVVILLIMAVGSIFRADFGLFYYVPNDSSFLYPVTDVIDTYVVRSLRTIGDVSMSTAVGFYQSVVGLVLVLVTNYIIKKINEENALW
ncbi:sugar ABC transporter permease [Paenibacillus rhizovicinus]|uniref:Sugar ABC transporter permease n=1 Tax=Paenibacillus rhizovicinus TaxID=2704463 RepID=A0A6C0P3Y0_9BACL|nr:ABC transporter permease subunit [Paenibacillus rhizovicinus]QHW32976.1 sugar ABC transporter permease [Paenibacillus rhizovicinus]